MTSESTIGSPEVNKSLRRLVSPVVRAHGFQKVGPRKSWSWRDSCIWICFIRSVGSYFSTVTGWPPMSLVVDLGVFYDFIPSRRKIKQDSKGQLLPEEYQCELIFRSQLSRLIDQDSYTMRLANPADRARRDIWWIERDGSNVEEVAVDIAARFVDQARPWFDKLSDLNFAFAQIENEKDCYSKYRAATYFAKRLGLEEKYTHYSKFLEAEEKKLHSKGLQA
jgi:hypothetical protein